MGNGFSRIGIPQFWTNKRPVFTHSVKGVWCYRTLYVFLGKMKKELSYIIIISQ